MLVYKAVVHKASKNFWFQSPVIVKGIDIACNHVTQVLDLPR
jgi:hypothetical protein